jgi:hypothetical protein
MQLAKALRTANLSLRRRDCRAQSPGLLQLVLRLGRGPITGQSRRTPEMRWHSASNSS